MRSINEPEFDYLRTEMAKVGIHKLEFLDNQRFPGDCDSALLRGRFMEGKNTKVFAVEVSLALMAMPEVADRLAADTAQVIKERKCTPSP
jgi:hypothetical protein